MNTPGCPMSGPERRCAECGKVTPPGSIHTCSPQVAPYVPTPGTRITVDGVTWEYTDGPPFSRWFAVGSGWVRHHEPSNTGRLFTRIAELEDDLDAFRALAKEAWELVEAASESYWMGSLTGRLAALHKETQ